MPKKSYISFKKTDEEGNPLAGAEFAFYNQLGQVMEIAKSGENGYFKIATPPDGTYVFREITAPEGYEISPEVYHFTVENGKMVRGIFEIKNEKIQEKKKGWIQAFYERKGRNAGYNSSYNGASDHSLKTGDNNRIIEVLVMTFACALAAGWCFLKGANDAEKKKRLLGFGGILIGTILLAGFSAAAQEVPKEEPFYVSEEIIYRDIQGIEDVPQTAWIMVRDSESGKRVRRLLPLETVSYLNEYQKESEKSERRENTVVCRAVYSGLIARENAEALPDLKGEYSSKIHQNPKMIIV